jgi:hypothetical protein
MRSAVSTNSHPHPIDEISCSSLPCRQFEHRLEDVWFWVIGGHHAHIADIHMCAATTETRLALVENGTKKISSRLVQILEPFSSQDPKYHRRDDIVSSCRTDQHGGIPDQIVLVLPENRLVVHTSTRREVVEWLHSASTNQRRSTDPG